MNRNHTALALHLGRLGRDHGVYLMSRMDEKANSLLNGQPDEGILSSVFIACGDT